MTGLPDLPEGHYWEIEESYGKGELSIKKKYIRTIQERTWWGKERIISIDEVKTVEKQVIQEVLGGAETTVETFNLALEAAGPEFVLIGNYDLSSDEDIYYGYIVSYWVTPERIKTTAQIMLDILETRLKDDQLYEQRKATLKRYVGTYPPKDVDNA